MKAVLSILSGVLLPLALPNDYFLYGNPWIGTICLVPVFFALYQTRSLKEGMGLTALFGGISTFLSNYWLMYFKDYAFLTIGSVTLAYCGVYAVWGGFFWRFSRPHPYRPLYMAAIWTLFEFFKSIGYLAYPWGLIVYPFNELLPILQIADLGGIWPLSFLFAFGNSFVAELMIGNSNQDLIRAPRYGICLIATILLYVGYGYYRMGTPIPETSRIRVVLVQQNMDPWEMGKEIENLRTLLELSRKGIQQLNGMVDLVVWSESSLPRPIQENRQYYQRVPPEESFLSFLKQWKSYFLIGNPVVRRTQDRKEVQNGVVLLDSTGMILDTYGKRHPVPMAEHVPFYEIPLVQAFFTKVIGLGGIWALGDKDTIFRIKDAGGKEIRFGAPICFEDAFPYLCRRFILAGADLLINITNDAWSRRMSAQVQHFVVARFRSIEMKRTLIRATNGGVTCVIGPFGEVIASLPMFQKEVLSIEVPIQKESTSTFYTKWGDWFPLLLFGLLLVTLLREKKTFGEIQSL
ncbi:MAG: apolipoprotein N-acyltransferase [Spirochaetes bacterium]|nr:apolipoprotein N-acyltransferase [Spirochaetota bacterium]